mmetsp:Transcript_30049/g.46089  ORF Transcript_30049/g.46089 Transcript_30049/m.46089 type:complete len:88 (+) Transcript_30049:778-1041(+)
MGNLTQNTTAKFAISMMTDKTNKFTTVHFVTSADRDRDSVSIIDTACAAMLAFLSLMMNITAFHNACKEAAPFAMKVCSNQQNPFVD